MDVELISVRYNNNIDAKLTASRANNNTDVEVDAGGLVAPNKISEKEAKIFEWNLL